MKNIKGSKLKNVRTGKIKLQVRVRFDGRQPTNVDLIPIPTAKEPRADLTPYLLSDCNGLLPKRRLSSVIEPTEL